MGGCVIFNALYNPLTIHHEIHVIVCVDDRCLRIRNSQLLALLIAIPVVPDAIVVGYLVDKAPSLHTAGKLPAGRADEHIFGTTPF